MRDFVSDTGPELPLVTEVPRQLDLLPDGREALVVGDVEKCKEYTHPQGDNPYGYRGTCGLVSIEGIARLFGIDIDEAGVVTIAIITDLCNNEGAPDQLGGTSVFGQTELLKILDIPATAVRGQALDDLAGALEEGRGVIIETNAGVLWDRADYYGDGSMNHAVVATGVARDVATGEILGFYINDSGTGDAGRFVPADVMQEAWVEAGGYAVITNDPAPAYR